MAWRWREDSRPGDPAANMAADTGLLEELIRDPLALPIVRVYRWDRRSVSFGRLQDEDEVRRAFPDTPLVRRTTGGRAVLHGNDLTVTVAARETDLPPTVEQGVMSSYRQIVGGIVFGLETLGVASQLGSKAKRTRHNLPVDCFAVAASCDVVERGSGRKLAGCAQRRLQGVVLQQMSIPLIGLPSVTAITAALKAGLQDALAVEEWVAVDTAYPV